MMRSVTVGMCLALLLPVLSPAAASGQGCGLEATPIPGLGLAPGVTGTVNDMTMFDDGSGEALIVGGRFTVLDASGRSIKGVARWDGSAWSSIGETGSVESMVAFDDGSGPALIAAGFLSTSLPHEERSIRRWKDGAWGPIGDGLRSGGFGQVNAVKVVEYEGQEALVAVGSGLRAGGETVSAAVWNGAEWEPLGDAPTSFSHIESFRGALWAASSSSNPVYRLEGGAWVEIEEIPNGGPLRSFADEGVEYLYVGGAGGTGLGRFDGVSFEQVAAGLDRAAIGLTTAVESGRSVLYARSRFMIRRYDGSVWSAVGEVAGRVVQGSAMLAARLGGADALLVGGSFESVDGTAALSIASYSAGGWTALGRAAPPVVTAVAESPTAGDDAVYIGGTGLYNAAGEPLGYTAVLRAGAAEAVGGELDSPPTVMLFHDDGAGLRLYAGGTFDFGGQRGPVVRWDGAAWRHVGTLGPAGGFPRADALIAFDDGSGPALYAGGEFVRVGAPGLVNVARWRGAEWERVGDGLDIQVLDFDVAEVDGQRRLLAGGTDRRASAPPALWYWDSSDWIRFPGDLTGHVSEFAVRRSAGGTELLVAGWVRMPGLTGGWLLGGYDGDVWQRTGIDLIESGGMASSLQGKSIGMFEAFPCGGGDAMIVSPTGSLWLNLPGGERIEGVLILDDHGWREAGADGVILTSAHARDGSFLIGGRLTSFGGVDFIGPARLHVNSCYADCDGSGELDFFDFLCFQNEFAAGAAGADCDGSGELDFFDFLCFQNEFAAGCP